MNPTDPRPGDDGPRIVVRGLSKRYGTFDAVAGVDLEVTAGEIVSLLGPNGAGKTTTLRMLMGVLRATQGEARIAGHDCFAERAEVMRYVGYLPDEPVFYDYLTGREILQFVSSMRGLPPALAAERETAFVERLGLEEAMTDYAVNYSKGMRKKLALACALIHEPEVVVLDEPTNGLDPYATRTVHAMVRERAAAGAAVLFSTHLLDQAERLSDRVAILFGGRLAAVGRLEELRARLAPGGSLEEVFFAVTSHGTP